MTQTSPEGFCRDILPQVSRTFALNIPVLPEPLDLAVTIAYLLCRIADTLEDEAVGDIAARTQLFSQLGKLVELPPNWQAQSATFTQNAVAMIRPQANPSEVALLKETPVVLQAMANLPKWTHSHIAQCVRAMTDGMAEIARMLEGRGPLGLPDVQDTMTYCYYVAGTVGEMLTGLFLETDKQAAEKEQYLTSRARAFGRALQLTNILKDVREDLERGACWLPRTMMSAHGLEASTLLVPANRPQATRLMKDLIALARVEVDVALEYSLAIPTTQPGIRLFCLWPLFFAVATLGKLQADPGAVFEAAPVKISRETVMTLMAQTQENVSSNEELRVLYNQCLANLDNGAARTEVRA